MLPTLPTLPLLSTLPTRATSALLLFGVLDFSLLEVEGSLIMAGSDGGAWCADFCDALPFFFSLICRAFSRLASSFSLLASRFLLQPLDFPCAELDKPQPGFFLASEWGTFEVTGKPAAGSASSSDVALVEVVSSSAMTHSPLLLRSSADRSSSPLWNR